MKKYERYILITVCEGEIFASKFEEHDKAHLQMMKEFCEAAQINLQDCSNPTWDDYEYGYNENSAYVFDGANHDNFSWRIIDMEETE